MSDRYAVEFERSAKKNLDRLDGPIRARVLRKVAALGDDPRPSGASRLVGADDLWRVRVGDYRVVYAIENNRLVVIVVRIAALPDLAAPVERQLRQCVRRSSASETSWANSASTAWSSISATRPASVAR